MHKNHVLLMLARQNLLFFIGHVLCNNIEEIISQSIIFG